MKISNKSLEQAQAIAHYIWAKYDDTYGYRTEKQEANQAVKPDHPENMYFYWQQFDPNNQAEFWRMIKLVENPTIKDELIEWVVEYCKESMTYLRETFNREDVEKWVGSTGDGTIGGLNGDRDTI